MHIQRNCLWLLVLFVFTIGFEYEPCLFLDGCRYSAFEYFSFTGFFETYTVLEYLLKPFGTFEINQLTNSEKE